MTDFRVDIRNHNDTKLKITWAHSIPFLAYFVNYGSIKRVAERIRDTLSKLVNECLENPDAGSLNTALEKTPLLGTPPEPIWHGILRAVATYCSQIQEQC